MWWAGEMLQILVRRSPSRRSHQPSTALTHDEKSRTASGRLLMLESSVASFHSSIIAVHRARCPPADCPAAASRLGSRWNFPALRRTHRIADLASITDSIGLIVGCGTTPFSIDNRYSTEKVTRPILA